MIRRDGHIVNPGIFWSIKDRRNLTCDKIKDLDLQLKYIVHDNAVDIDQPAREIKICPGDWDLHLRDDIGLWIALRWRSQSRHKFKRWCGRCNCWLIHLNRTTGKHQ